MKNNNNPVTKNIQLKDVNVSGKKKEVTPIIVSDSNDPRLKAYNDSLSLYNESLNAERKISRIFANAYKRAGFNKNSINETIYEGYDIINNPNKYLKKKPNEVDSKVKKYNKKGVYYPSDPTSKYLATPEYPANIENLIQYNKKSINERKEYINDPTTDINGLTTKERIELNHIALKSLNKQKSIMYRTGYNPTHFIPNAERPPSFIFKKPTQPIIYQKSESIQTNEPVKLKTIDQAWVPVENTIVYDVNGKSTYSTSDKMPDLFPEYNELKKAGSSEEVINAILKQKYNLRYYGKTLKPSAETQNLLENKLYKSGKKTIVSNVVSN